MKYLFIVYGVFFLATIIFSIVINGLFLKFARTLGIRNSNQNLIRWSSEHKPSMGGISFFIIFLLSTIAYPFFFHSSVYFLNIKFLGILLASSLAFLMGLYDDAFNTHPVFKFFTQLACALILIFTHTYINIFPQIFLNYFITIFWVVGLMNSINMLDNMDAIATIVASSIILTILLSLFIDSKFTNPEILPLLGLFGALIGFLYYNWHPSKIFMGDTGSQFLGLYLAAIGITFFWNGELGVGNWKPEAGSWKVIAHCCTAVLIFSLAIIDTTVVVIKRMSAKKSPFIGGKDHTTHHLSYLGLSDSQVAYIFIGISVISSVFTLFIIHYPLSIIFPCFYILILFILLFFIANLNKPIRTPYIPHLGDKKGSEVRNQKL